MSHKRRCLGDAVEFIRGITFKPEDVVSPSAGGAIVCMRTKNIQEHLDESDLIAVPEKFVRRSELYLQEGDVLISSANSWNLVGKVVQVPNLSYRATAGGFIAIVRARRDMIDAQFLYRWLATDRTQAAIRACSRKTTNISNLSVPQFLNLPIEIPSLEEQRHIASILDKADDLGCKRKEANRLANKFLRAKFNDIFGSRPKTKMLTDYCEFLAGYAFKSDQYVPANDGVRLLRGVNVGIECFEWTDTASYPIDATVGLDRYRLLSSDVVLAMDRPWISSGLKCAVVDEATAGSLLVQRVARLRPKQPEYGMFIFNCLQAGDFRNHCRITETTIPHISPKDFATFQVPDASYVEIRMFANLVEKVRCMLKNAVAAGDLADQLQASLHGRFFAGD